MNGTGWISFQLREEWVRRRSRDRSRQDRVWEWEKRGRKDTPPARNGATFPTAFGTCYCTTIKLFLLRHSWTFHGPLKRRYIYRFLVLETFRGYSPFWVKSLRGRRGRKGGTSGSPNVRVSRFFASFALCDPVETEPRGPWLGVDRVRGCVPFARHAVSRN